MAKNFDWMLGACVTVAEADVTIAPNFAAPPRTWGTYYLLIDASQLESRNDTMRVERVVGSSYIFLTADVADTDPAPALGPVECIERLYVAECDEVGDVQDTHELLGDAVGVTADFDRTWMWERRRIIIPYESRFFGTWPPSAGVGSGIYSSFQAGVESSWGGQALAHPYWTEIDTRVKRRLTGREVLVYDIQVESSAFSGPDMGDTWRLFTAPRLRVGVAW